jgi:uncharacterized protein
MIRLLIFGLLIYLGYRAVRTLVDGSSLNGRSVSGKNVGKIDDVMIKDPYCEVYFPQKEGVHLREGGKDLYFCSEDCRDKYLDEKGDG